MLGRIFLIILIIPFLNACIAAAVTGATAIGYGIAQERTVGTAVDDAAISTRINAQYFGADTNLFSKIDVDVHESRVLLTGNVQNPADRLRAVEMAWGVRGVKEVINEIQVSNKKGFASYAKDVWISSQVKSKLLLQKNLHSVNYSVDTVNGIVYLFGLAMSESELDAAKHIAGTVKGVKQVVSHVRLINSKHRDI